MEKYDSTKLCSPECDFVSSYMGAVNQIARTTEVPGQLEAVEPVHG